MTDILRRLWHQLTVGLARVQAVEGPLVVYSTDTKLSAAYPGDSGDPIYPVIEGRAGVVGPTSFGTLGCPGSVSVYTNLQNPVLRPRLAGLSALSDGWSAGNVKPGLDDRGLGARRKRL